MKKLLVITLGILTFSSCSNDSNDFMPTNDPSASDMIMKGAPIGDGGSGEFGEDPNDNSDPYCYDFTSNEDYNCGWTAGYRDYVYHYNYVAQNILNYSACYTVFTGATGSSPSDPALYTVQVSSGYIIPNKVKREFRDYFNLLDSRKNDSDYDNGKYHGYIAFRGAEPLSNNPNCN
ncbi:hypothetical protein [Psychroserpens algicola]|uniref:hypothetical protein n=1 Tax=Psychroserpens algicola TaxID=1719034 RepID=UPI0019540776|nr:hypothetical protein [Psychroserpens algicola]